eukprot:gnl/MRDRNA2_/MRDRNA2_70075_c0_seq1.p1 gnl/MRDRNA2_/MRDRNA2_70075_c0~~gnl/MRDRNA2_/MRDRNA2_70075_c0_seq1.p1  ORF type:complete len:1063 (-),score=212.48 gnl/MRDRNA2_/MRDRNA2_70075_c0_seq1:89-3277(-)
MVQQDGRGGSSSGEAPIFVAMRVRPMNAREIGTEKIVSVSNGAVSLMDEHGGAKTYPFDVTFNSMSLDGPEFADQAKVYNEFGRTTLVHILNGYNTTVFAYGQTGTGKTYTMIGGTAQGDNDQGLVPRTFTDIFVEVEKLKQKGYRIQLRFRMLEIYNEALQDLLVQPTHAKDREPLSVHVHPTHGVYIPGLTEAAVSNYNEVMELLTYGNTMKTVAATSMNHRSSRAHTVIALRYDKNDGQDVDTVLSEVFFVDLAGRENEKTTSVKGQQLVELSFINRSLFHLSQCIHGLSSDHPTKGVSKSRSTSKGLSEHHLSLFRNSKLTMLLSQALSGNSKTAMMGTLSPSSLNFEDNLATLRFAGSVKNIKVQSTAQVVNKKDLVMRLQTEIAGLKSELSGKVVPASELKECSEQVEALQHLCHSLEQSSEKAQHEAEEARKKRAEAMARMGLLHWNLAKTQVKSLVHELKVKKLPCLENVSEDPQLTGTLSFHIPEGSRVSVGSSRDNGFILQGLGICDRLCTISNNDGELSLKLQDAEANQVAPRVEVNGFLIEPSDDSKILKHSDTVLFGYAFSFQVCITEEMSKATSAQDTREAETSIEQLLMALSRDPDPKEQQAAMQYGAQLLKVHALSDRRMALHAFILSAYHVMRLVEEANFITEAVRPELDVRFQLGKHGPLLAQGFAPTRLPHLCVWLVKHHNARQVRWRKAGQAALRAVQSKHAGQMAGAVKDLTKFAWETSQHPNSKTEISYIWSIEKFVDRLSEMRDVHDAWERGKEAFQVDPYQDPWAEYGGTEVQHQLALQKQQIMEQQSLIQTLREDLEVARAEERLDASRRETKERSRTKTPRSFDFPDPVGQQRPMNGPVSYNPSHSVSKGGSSSSQVQKFDMSSTHLAGADKAILIEELLKANETLRAAQAQLTAKDEQFQLQQLEIADADLQRFENQLFRKQLEEANHRIRTLEAALSRQVECRTWAAPSGMTRSYSPEPAGAQQVFQRVIVTQAAPGVRGASPAPYRSTSPPQFRSKSPPRCFLAQQPRHQSNSAVNGSIPAPIPVAVKSYQYN